jgi:hypothetical protein
MKVFRVCCMPRCSLVYLNTLLRLYRVKYRAWILQAHTRHVRLVVSPSSKTNAVFSTVGLT